MSAPKNKIMFVKKSCLFLLCPNFKIRNKVNKWESLYMLQICPSIKKYKIYKIFETNRDFESSYYYMYFRNAESRIQLLLESWKIQL